VICVDEFGPMELRPHAGRSWQPRRHAHRQRATYTRKHGVRHLLAAYDVRTGRLWGHVRKRKRAREFLVFLKAIRRQYRGVIWIVMDNLSAHKTPDILRWARRNNVRFQFTPTDASWLNRIECQFTHLKKNVLSHCDYDSFDQMRTALHRYLHWHNRRKARQLKLKRH
jgi:transposase